MTTTTLDTDEQKVSYGFGLQFGQQLLRNQFDGLDAQLVAKGMTDILEKNELLATEDAINAAFGAVQQKLQEKQAEQAKKMSELGKAFLAENARREGVITTESGLQYEVLEEGSGARPAATDTVKTHYHGTFVDGTVFDSSVERGEPATFALDKVIDGWTEALQLMGEGAKWRVFVPSHLGYGEMGSPPVIPGGTTLVFEIHLMEVLK